jgi:acyl carrier protein
MMEDIREIIQGELLSLIEATADQTLSVPLDGGLVLLESGVDSLGFAILVTRLEMLLGYDPFTLDPNPVYPRTFDDFVKFYEKYSNMQAAD